MNPTQPPLQVLGLFARDIVCEAWYWPPISHLVPSLGMSRVIPLVILCDFIEGYKETFTS